MPSDAEAVAVAKAVVADIEAATLSQEFTLERSYADWALELKNATPLRVDVCLVTTKQEVDASTRSGRLAYTIPIDVAVRKRFGADTQDDDTGRIPIERVDELMLLVQEIHELFTQQRLSEYLSAIWKEAPKILVAPLIKHWRDCRQFTGIVRLTFQSDRQP